jgi:hypothetical protein
VGLEKFARMQMSQKEEKQKREKRDSAALPIVALC